MDIPLPNCAEPVENFDGRWHSNNNRRKHKRRTQKRTHAGKEHMVSPDNKAQECDSHNSKNHCLIAKDCFAGKRCQNVRYNPHDGYNHNINRRVRIEPEKVLPEYRLPAATCANISTGWIQTTSGGKKIFGNKNTGMEYLVNKEWM